MRSFIRPRGDRRHKKGFVKIKRKIFHAYKRRDENLMRMGFHCYSAYLGSALWKKIRDDKLLETPACELCDGKASHVHHLSYRMQCLNGKKPYHLVCLCKICHTLIEMKPDGSKRMFEAVNKQLKQKLVRLGRWEIHKRKGYLAAHAETVLEEDIEPDEL